MFLIILLGGGFALSLLTSHLAYAWVDRVRSTRQSEYRSDDRVARDLHYVAVLRARRVS